MWVKMGRFNKMTSVQQQSGAVIRSVVLGEGACFVFFSSSNAILEKVKDVIVLRNTRRFGISSIPSKLFLPLHY